MLIFKTNSYLESSLSYVKEQFLWSRRSQIHMIEDFPYEKINTILLFLNSIGIIQDVLHTISYKHIVFQFIHILDRKNSLDGVWAHICRTLLWWATLFWSTKHYLAVIRSTKCFWWQRDSWGTKRYFQIKVSIFLIFYNINLIHFNHS